MKNIAAIFTLSILLVSCGGGNDQSVEALLQQGDLTAIKAKKKELTDQQRELKTQIDTLNSFINSREKNTNAYLVHTMTIKDTVFKHYVDVQGNVETDENIVIYPEYTGVLTRVYVDEGQKVRKGQTLAKIDDGGLSSQLAQQETQVALAKTTYERQQRLWDQKIGSEIQFLEAKANYEASEKAADQIRAQIAKSVITAPFSGEIDDVIAEQGQVVMQGQSQVFRLVNLSDMYIKANLPEAYLKSVKKGTDVKIRLASIGEEFDGTVRQVGNYINPDNRTFSVEISIPNKDGLVKPNMIATVLVNDYTKEEAITIPENILQENSEGEIIAYIYKPDSDTTAVAERVILKIGKNYGNQVEVISGLEEGDTIITEGAKSVRDGQKVSARNN